MKGVVNNARRVRKRLSTTLNDVARALEQSHQFAAAGQFVKATRAAQLAERCTKLAAQLVNLDASLKQIAVARTRALAAIASACADAEARLEPDFAIHPDTDPADMRRNWSMHDPRVQALFKKAMEKGRMPSTWLRE